LGWLADPQRRAVDNLQDRKSNTCMHFKLGLISFPIPWVDSPILNEGRLITYKAGSYIHTCLSSSVKSNSGSLWVTRRSSTKPGWRLTRLEVVDTHAFQARWNEFPEPLPWLVASLRKNGWQRTIPEPPTNVSEKDGWEKNIFWVVKQAILITF